MEIENVILDILSNVLDHHLNIDKANSIKWDSLKHILIITALEDAFDIFFEPEEISDMLNYKEIVRVVKLKLTHTDQ